MIVPFIGGSYVHRSKKESAQRTLNMYVEKTEDDKVKNQEVLISRPAVELYNDLSGEYEGDGRGIYSVAAKLDPLSSITSRTFAWIGSKLIEIIDRNNYIERATISNLSSRISACDTGRYLVFVDTANMYAYDLETESFQEITLPFKEPVKVRYMNSRVVCTNTDEEIDEIRNYNKVYWSDLNDPLTWNALSWFNVKGSGSGDPVNSIGIKQGNIWLYGFRSFEVWRNSNNPDIPFSYVGGSGSEIGCGAPDSVAEIADQLFWLGSSRAGKNQVYMSNGYNAVRISTFAEEKILDDAGTTTTDAVGFTFQIGGHTFYVLTLIQANKTLVYDLTSNEWYDWSTRDPNINVDNRWAPLFSTFGNEEILVLNSKGPQVLSLNLNKYEDWDVDGIDNKIPLVRERQSPVYWNGYRLMFHKEFQLDMETGVGIQQEVQGNTPKAMLQYSDDGGVSWSSEKWVNVGKIGERRTRVRWRRLGRSRERVYRVRISDPVKVILLSAKVVAERGQFE